MAGNTLRLRFTQTKNIKYLLHQYGQAVVTAAYKDVTLATRKTAERARAAAPVSSGALRDSISATVRTDGYSIRGKVRVRVPYAAFLEYGTEEIAKKPHLVPAAIDERKQMQARIIDAIVDKSPSVLGKPTITGRDAPLPDMHMD